MLKTVCRVLTSCAFLGWTVNADCISPPTVPNASNNITGSPPYQKNTVARYDCNIGYTTSGTSRYYTCKDTEWIGGNILCEMIYCSYVAPPENGKILNTPNNEVGTSINFACNEGYDISGANTVLCRTDGKWSPATPPECTAKDCGEFGSIQYASVFQDNSEFERNHYGSVVEVTCQYGRVLNGPPRVKCEANGQWGERPSCDLLQCPPYPKTNASCIYGSALFGTYYFISCKEDISTRTGPDMAECIEGHWDSLDMACYCDCYIPDFNANLITFSNLNLHSNLPHKASLHWKCSAGSSRSSFDDVICMDGILWAMENGVKIFNSISQNTSEVNLDILSKLCILDTTETSSTSASTPESVATKMEVDSITQPKTEKDPFLLAEKEEDSVTSPRTNIDSVKSPITEEFVTQRKTEEDSVTPLKTEEDSVTPLKTEEDSVTPLKTEEDSVTTPTTEEDFVTPPKTEVDSVTPTAEVDSVTLSTNYNTTLKNRSMKFSMNSGTSSLALSFSVLICYYFFHFFV